MHYWPFMLVNCIGSLVFVYLQWKSKPAWNWRVKQMHFILNVMCIMTCRWFWSISLLHSHSIFVFYITLSKRISFNNFPYLVAFIGKLIFPFVKVYLRELNVCSGLQGRFFSLKPKCKEASSSFLTWEKQLIFSKHFLFCALVVSFFFVIYTMYCNF